jgi:hypothetical protein
LDLCFENLIPQVRGLLFGERPKIANAESEIEKLEHETREKLAKANAKFMAAGTTRNTLPSIPSCALAYFSPVLYAAKK